MRLRTICKSKIHHAIVTQADLNYVGSIAIDELLLDSRVYDVEDLRAINFHIHYPLDGFDRLIKE